MTPLAGYLVRSAISLALLFLFYEMFLSREKMHRFNRFYLLFSLIFSLVVPLISIEWFTISGIKVSQLNLNQIQGQYVKFEVLPGIPEQGSIIQLKNIYFLVLSILIARFIYNIFILLFRSRYRSVTIKGHRVVPVKGLALPHTFVSTVFINEDEMQQGTIPDALLIHEFAHIEQYHSIDIIIVELIKTIFWFNPVFILYKRAIMLNHEYLADEVVIESHSDVAGYSEILFNTVFRKNNKYLASSFNYSLTKKRLLMLSKKNFPMTILLKKLIVMPLLMVTGFLVINAQDPPPPPPPPPPLESESWWLPFIEKYQLKNDHSKAFFTGTLFETGEEFSEKDSVLTIRNAFILSKTEGNFMNVIRAETAKHDLRTNVFVCRGVIHELFDLSNTEKPDISEKLDDFSFRLLNGLSSIPPPPPPPPPAR